MRSEKLFNAMENLENKYIAEALEEYGSAKDIESEEYDTDDPYIEAVLINAEDNSGNKKGRFIKWAGLAAGVCAVAAGVIIMGKIGLFAGVGIPASSAATEANADTVIVSIIDRTKTEGLDYATALEKFFEDDKYEYYFGGLYSQLIIVHYQDGSQEDIVTALNAGRATIADLDRFEVGYSYRSLGGDCDEFHSGPVSKTEQGLEDRFDLEEVEFTDIDAKSFFCNTGINSVYENKLYYLKTAPEEKKITVYAYDIENKTTETVYEEYRDHTSLFSPQVVSVYGNNVFIQDFVMVENTAGCTFNISKLDLSTKTLKVIYTLGCFPVTEQVYLSVKNSGKYAFFEEWQGDDAFNIIRYDTESGEMVIFKENASKPVPHKDKLIYYRSVEEEQGLYCCDLESGEKEQKLCDLSLYDYSETICSDGEKIWVSPTVFNTYDAYHTIEYLDGDNNLVSVCRLSGCALDSIKYAEGYILSDGVFINAITGEIVYRESQGIVIKDHKLYAVIQTYGADGYKIYRLKAK